MTAGISAISILIAKSASLLATIVSLNRVKSHLVSSEGHGSLKALHFLLVFFFFPEFIVGNEGLFKTSYSVVSVVLEFRRQCALSLAHYSEGAELFI